MSTPKPRADWEAIERDYRVGSLSIRELAKQNGLSDTAIRKKAKEQHWDRDLAGKVRAKANAQLVRVSLRDANPETEQQTIDNAASQQVAVVLGHRTIIGRLNGIVNLLADQLEEAALNRTELEQEIEVLTAADESPKRRNTLMKAVSLGSHSTTLVNLTSAAKTVQQLERQAFNISDEPAAPSDALSAFVEAIQKKGSRLLIKSEPTQEDE